ncbi:hypothetical protein IFR05_014909 [Cadophora sp. M221]|nr:hypothetical protein IFR05_014909 [Cadophora sp. M221]
MRLLGQILVETVFKNDVDTKGFLRIAEEAGRNNIEYVASVYKDLLDGKSISQPNRLLVVGRYYNSIKNYSIDIKLAGEKLRVAYVGAKQDNFDLETYQVDSFFWWLDYDESAKRVRLPGYPPRNTSH